MAQINLLQTQGAGKKKKILADGAKPGSQAKSQPFKFDFNIKSLSKWFYQVSAGVIIFMVLTGASLFYFSFRAGKELNAAKNKELIFSGSPKELKELQDKKKNLEDALVILKGILENKTYLAPIMNALSNDVPDGIWFNQVVFQQQSSAKDKDAAKVFILKINGFIYSRVAGSEIDILEQFTRLLKDDNLLKDSIDNVKIGTVSKSAIVKQDITNFDMEILFK